MLNQFNYVGFSPDENLRDAASLTLERILDMAPYGAKAAALIEKCDGKYRSALELYSRIGPLVANAVGTNPLQVIEAIERSLKSKLEKWKRQKRTSDSAMKHFSELNSVAECGGLDEKKLEPIYLTRSNYNQRRKKL